MGGALLAALLLLALPAAASAKEVLVVGDSLEVGTGPYLPRALPHDSVTVDAKKSRSSNVGVGVLRSRLKAGQAVVGFDLGTNDDPGAPGRPTAAVADRLGDLPRSGGHARLSALGHRLPGGGREDHPGGPRRPPAGACARQALAFVRHGAARRTAATGGPPGTGAAATTRFGRRARRIRQARLPRHLDGGDRGRGEGEQASRLRVLPQ